MPAVEPPGESTSSTMAATSGSAASASKVSIQEPIAVAPEAWVMRLDLGKMAPYRGSTATRLTTCTMGSRRVSTAAWISSSLADTPAARRANRRSITRSWSSSMDQGEESAVWRMRS